jgi:hypothetical protein
MAWCMCMHEHVVVVVDCCGIDDAYYILSTSSFSILAILYFKFSNLSDTYFAPNPCHVYGFFSLSAAARRRIPAGRRQ